MKTTDNKKLAKRIYDAVFRDAPYPTVARYEVERRILEVLEKPVKKIQR